MPANIQISGIDCEIIYAGSGLGVVNENPSAQETYLIAWSDLPNFVKALKGYWTQLGGAWTYTPPHAHPLWTNWYCIGVDWTGKGNPRLGTNQAIFDHAIVTAQYGPLAYDPTSGDVAAIVHEEIDFDIETRQYPPGTLVSASGVFTRYYTPLVIPCATYILTLDAIPELPGGDAEIILDLLGKVNDDTFRGAAAKKMRFDGARTRRSAAKIPSLDQSWFSLELRFKYRPYEWTKEFIPDTGWVEVLGPPPASAPIYQQGDFDTLLPS